MTPELLVLGIAFVLAVIVGIPLGIMMSQPRARLLSVLGALVFAALAAAGVYAFASGIELDLLSFGLGAFGLVTAGAFIGVFVANFLVSLRDRRPSGIPTEL